MFLDVEYAFVIKNGDFQHFFVTGSRFFALCPLCSFKFNCALNELKKCEEFSVISTVYCQKSLQPSYSDVNYLFK